MPSRTKTLGLPVAVVQVPFRTRSGQGSPRPSQTQKSSSCPSQRAHAGHRHLRKGQCNMTVAGDLEFSAEGNRRDAKPAMMATFPPRPTSLYGQSQAHLLGHGAARDHVPAWTCRRGSSIQNNVHLDVMNTLVKENSNQQLRDKNGKCGASTSTEGEIVAKAPAK